MRVLLLDDEKYIVEYLKHLVDWSKYDYSEVLTFTNSVKAVDYLENHDIDLLVTDIRMPELSGLEVAEKMFTQKKALKMIFLTGYSDFEYARQAIHYGVKDYILKPVTKSDLENVLQAIQPKNGHATHSSREAVADAQHVFATLLSIVSNDSEDQTLTRYFANDNFCFFKDLENYAEVNKAILLFGDKKFGLGSVAQLAGHSCATSAPFLLSSKDQLRQAFYAFFGHSTFRRHYLEDTEQFADFNLADEDNKLPAKFFELEVTMQQIYLLWQLEQCLEKGVEVSQNIILQLHDTKRFFDILVTAIEKNEHQSSGKKTIAKLHDYINNNLEQALTLEDLALHVYMHPAYLSKLYKQETNENLSVYITNQRLNKAIQLLMESNLMVSDIGKMVGYKTSQYFIKIFKEKYQMTPQQYRRNHM